MGKEDQVGRNEEELAIVYQNTEISRGVYKRKATREYIVNEISD